MAVFTLENVLLEAGGQNTHTFFLSLVYSLLSMPANVAIAWVFRRFARWNDDLHFILLWIGATFVISRLDALIVGGGYALVNGQPALSRFWNALLQT